MTSSRVLLPLLLIMNMNQSLHHPMYNNHLIQGKHFWLIIIKDQYHHCHPRTCQWPQMCPCPCTCTRFKFLHLRCASRRGFRRMLRWMCAAMMNKSVCAHQGSQGLMSTIFYILEKYNLDVVSAHVTSDSYRRMYIYDPSPCKSHNLLLLYN